MRMDRLHVNFDTLRHQYVASLDPNVYSFEDVETDSDSKPILADILSEIDSDKNIIFPITSPIAMEPKLRWQEGVEAPAIDTMTAATMTGSGHLQL